MSALDRGAGGAAVDLPDVRASLCRTNHLPSAAFLLHARILIHRDRTSKVQKRLFFECAESDMQAAFT